MSYEKGCEVQSFLVIQIYLYFITWEYCGPYTSSYIYFFENSFWRLFCRTCAKFAFFYLPYLFILRVISLHVSVQNPFALSHTFHFFVHQLVKSHYCCNNLLDLDQACFWEKKRSTLNYEKYLQQQTQTMNNQTSHFDWNCTW